MIRFKRAESIAELKQILELQRKNLPSNLSDGTMKVEGFVTVHHTLELLKEMNDACAHFIALNDGEVIGYALCMHPKFKEEIDVLRPMFRQIEQYHKADDYIVMGQICIDKQFRKKGIFRKLYEEMLSGIQPEFSTIITEVDFENTRSLNAHYAIGFTSICEYQSHDRNWALIKLEAS